jgi:hypothetical protein
MIADEFGPSGHTPPRRGRTGRNDMTRSYAAAVAAMVAALGGAAWLAPASAAPPTVTPSPGYDARLQEQHAAQAAPVIYQPVAPVAGPVHRRHVKRSNGGAH